ncbi:recombinase family protein [Kocuria sp. U4B]
MARHETDQLSRRVKRALEQRAEQGSPHGLVPFGYQRVPVLDEEGRTIGSRDVRDPDNAEFIQDCARRVLAGESLRSIVGRANDEGRVAPRGSRWTSTSLRQVLLRPTNAGLRAHRGEIVGKSTTEPILSEDEFYRLSALLTDPGRRLSMGTSPRHLLSGIAECGLCGGKMRRVKSRVPDGGTNPEAYVCRECTRVRRSMTLVDGVVNNVMVGLLQRPDALAALSKGDPDAADEAQENVKALAARLEIAADQFAEGNITGEQLARITAKLRPQLEEARVQAAKYAPSSLGSSIAGEDALDRWESADIWTKRELIDALMVVTIMPVGPGRGRDPQSVKIEWKTGN